ncbi:alpha/beta hydrolase fold domain-containing protein [Umezawaea sp. Da 62-37]|uniref:alpha/beta hydrolase fold domain-containing protein n=1 Tax=Umezawaea sp. Da 62-37 TaxID=3075927 RepID=UPI0028F6C274|nr:alpha/beta hydrolase fold domain-containing protein [Umezawaea sp. Da 62-37]WNV86483.1 alpha/beta hydrolase fold domain-containing protein [Umezawaea sp. Da 62-37]
MSATDINRSPRLDGDHARPEDEARRPRPPGLPVDARRAPDRATGLVLAGDSAGGTLAIVTATALRDDPAPVPVLAQLTVYPAPDGSKPYPSVDEFADGYLLTKAGHEWYHHHYAPDVTDVRASPLLGDLTGLPPAVVLTAGLDPVRDQGRAYAAGLVAAGVPTTFLEAEGNVHAFVLMRKAVPSSQADVEAALTALRSLLP